MNLVVRVAVIPGDGIGKEVVPWGVRALEQAAEIHGGLSFDFTYFPYGSDYYLEFGRMMPEEGIQILSEFETIFLGAVGMPNLVPDHVSLWGLLIPIRREFRQFINLRPVKRIPGVPSPLASAKPFDFLVVRENSEGEYSSIGGRMHTTDDQIAIQNAVFTRKSVERAMHYAFALASGRNRSVTSATKSNGIVYTMPFWDDVFRELAQQYPEFKTNSIHIDALSAFFVTRPETLDVVVASNLFGDILTDLGAAIMGSIGIAPSANINPERKYPSMFEPVHGSAPDIHGKNIANPVGQIWSAKMMLDFLGYEDVADLLMKAIEKTMESGVRTGDLGGRASTTEVAEAILENMRKA